MTERNITSFYTLISDQTYSEIPFPTDIKLRVANKEWVESNLDKVQIFLI